MSDEPDKRARAEESAPGDELATSNDKQATPKEQTKPVPPVSMSKGPAHADDVSAQRPTTVVAAVAVLGVSALAAFGSAIAVYGQRDWLTRQTIKTNHDNISNAVSSAVSSASTANSDVASASASASSSAVSKWPTTAADVHNSVTQQQTLTLITALVFAAAVAFIASGMYRGRHWSRWGTVLFWVVATISTPYGLGGLLILRSSAPGAEKAFVFAAALLLVVAVVLANLRTSTDYFALSRPERAGAPPRRGGLFGPRPPVESQRSGTASGTQRAKSALRSSAATRGEAYVQKQRAKKRAAANRESIARGAELARSRAKASKSRRIEHDRRND